MVEIAFTLLFILISSWIIKLVPIYWIRRLAGSIFAAILGGFLAIGFLNDSFFSFVIVFLGFMYLCTLPIRIEKMNGRRQVNRAD
jgi:hypothetical protein